MSGIPAAWHDPAVIRGLLVAARTIAVVGLSASPSRTSNRVAAYMQAHGYRIVPVNPNELEALGERSYPALRDVPAPVDVVAVFRRPAAVPQVARDAVAVGATALCCQVGVVSEEGGRIAADAGLAVVMDRCLAVEQARLAAAGAALRVRAAAR